jgi:membrane fusion protein (multidrug efflux system)
MSKRAIVIPLTVLVVAALLFFAINGRWTSWGGARTDKETDDAYVQADITPSSTRISGTVRRMKVEDFDSVNAGQVLVEIDDSDYRSILRQARAALAASRATFNEKLLPIRCPASQLAGGTSLAARRSRSSCCRSSPASCWR